MTAPCGALLCSAALRSAQSACVFAVKPAILCTGVRAKRRFNFAVCA
ncbi:hypothetical protein HMPREF9193_01578 [Treponema lecithinolyticum ATCC 700332]|uniref:Lipoprotein n=1 Tax=Treponema lecithinolyticum ATCC 700332 TaxID=1321815 RepID=A0ABN0NY25_TRELE|nr:hypothetical protein HMPREF9193_01578 [Treponema lecithinolyticum ATCC 700332]